MSAILGYSRLLRDSKTTKVQSKYVNSILSAGENLLTIVNDILDFSKIEAGAIILDETEFNLREIINTLLNLNKLNAYEKNINLYASIDSRIPKKIVGDVFRLNQVIINLMNNAIKFTEKGEVEIAANLQSINNDSISIQFVVRDTGIGIPKDKISIIFESFKQANMDSTRKYGGTGLGLTISKRLVEFLGGTINVKSEENKGSEFSFVLNFKKNVNKYNTGKTPKTPIEITGTDVNHTKVLVVEDNLINQDLFQEIIELWGFKVDTANNGKIAIEKIKEKNYDVVLMDIQMPGMDGYETTKYLRTILKKEMHIIAMTAHAFKGEEEKCFEVGMNEYISKPFDPAELHSKILSVVNKK
jgi:CheY-like chemotaxis protein